MSAPDISKGSFTGHETFPFRYMWLRKAVEQVSQNGKTFGKDDAMVTFGVGKNMVRSIRHWGLATSMIEENPELKNNRGRVLRPSELGGQLFEETGWDPYLEDPATLWLIHWNLASTFKTATTWYWVFNRIPQLEFSKTQLVDWIAKAIHSSGGKRISGASIKRDVDCFVRTYVPSKLTEKSVSSEDTLDCPLNELALIRDFVSKGNYIIDRGEQPSLPDAVFAYALMRFIVWEGITVRTIPLDMVSFKPGSPGRVFCLSEDALLVRLERLDDVTDGALIFDDTAGLKQIMVHEDITEKLMEWMLKTHYTGRRRRKRSGR